MVLIICLVTEMIDWKQKLKNQWVQIEISRVQPGKPGNFLPLGPFPFQYSSAWRYISYVGYKTIVKQRQIQCIVWDVGFKQILICQTDICLELNREKEPPGHRFHSLFPLQKCKIQFIQTEVSVWYLHLYIRFSKQTTYMFNFSRVFCNTLPLLSVVRRILV